MWGLNTGFPVVRTGGRAGGRCMVTWLPNFLGWVDLLTHGAPQARFARQSSAIKIYQRAFKNVVNGHHWKHHWILGSLSKGVFERRTSTGSEIFFILKHLDATRFAFLSVFTIIEMICPKFGQNCHQKWKKDHFRLTCVAQKRLCLSLLLLTAPLGCGDIWGVNFSIG